MISTTMFRRGAALLLGVTALGVVPVAPTASAQVDSQGLGAGGEFFPVAPARIYDEKGIDADGSVVVDVVDIGGIPAENVLAVAVNVTIANVPGAGYASVSPSDFVSSASAPTSLINFQYAGHTVPNFGIIGVGEEGKIAIELVTPKVDGTARVIVDVFGFVATSSFAGTEDSQEVDGARMVTVTPKRLLNTRDTGGLTSGAALGAGQSIEVPIRGVSPVLASDNVSAVVVNMTGINNRAGSTSTYLAATPELVTSGSETSNGNYSPGVTKANLAIVPLNADGSIFIYNNRGEIHVALDVLAYLETGGADDSTVGRIVPLEAPFRSFDTRDAEFGGSRLGFSSWEDWSFDAFANSVRLDERAVGAQSGLFGNLTAVGLQRLYPSEAVKSFITMNPAISGDFPTEPANSNLNFDESGSVANASVVTYGSKDGDANMVSAYNANGRTHYILDVYAVILD
jgi:hypothetical protein